MSDKYVIARPYAKAAFDIANQSGTFSEWSDMLYSAALMVSDPDFVALIKHPKFSDDKALEWMLAIGDKVFDEKGKTFLCLLPDNKRLLFLPEIAILYEDLRKEAEKTVEAQVLSAKPLPQEQLERIKQALKARLKVSEIILRCKTDESLLGGALIRAGDIVIDGSARGRLRRIEEALGI